MSLKTLSKICVCVTINTKKMLFKVINNIENTLHLIKYK